MAVVIVAVAIILIPKLWNNDSVKDAINTDQESGENNNMDTTENDIKEEETKNESREGIEAMANVANKEDMSTYRDPNSIQDFRVIGYYPGWAGDIVDTIKWDKLTHINYAFAIPTVNGTMLDLGNKPLIDKLIKTAHENNVKVAISVGGWSYQDKVLEDTFVMATNTDEKCRTLADDILKMVDDYGFDGADMDWEYPKAGISEDQYEFFMTFLRQGLTSRGKYLTAAVVGSGSTGMGQTDYVLDMMDFINVMAYDGGSGEGHSPYSYAVECGEYWINTRGMDANRVTIGVPFYERPNWAAYADIVAADEAAAYLDSVEHNGTTIYYNGLTTMAEKTKWACENAGGIMIWELTQDSKTEELSLLNQINKTILEYYPGFKK
jgi:GH18 family chitinase